MDDDTDDIVADLGDDLFDFTGRHVAVLPVRTHVDWTYIRCNLFPRGGSYEGPVHRYGFMHEYRISYDAPSVFRPGLRLSAYLTPLPGSGWRELRDHGMAYLRWLLRIEARRGAAFSGESVDRVLAYLNRATSRTIEETGAPMYAPSVWAVAEIVETPAADVLLPLDWDHTSEGTVGARGVDDHG